MIPSEEEASIANLVGSTELLSWQKYTILARHYDKLTIADKRAIFGIMRKNHAVDGLENHYLPGFGITLGEFSMFHTIGEHNAKIRKNNKRSTSSLS
jgi:hypothetical protein